MLNQWLKLDDETNEDLWHKFIVKFRFRPSTEPTDWPSIHEPANSVTFDVRGMHELYSNKEQFHLAEKSLESWANAAFACILPNENIYALSLNHEGYSYLPPFQQTIADSERWPIWVCPLGEYTLFMTEDMRLGIFGHPWEASLCVFGKELMSVFSKLRFPLMERVMRGSLP